jgi:hypothetical protein
LALRSLLTTLLSLSHQNVKFFVPTVPLQYHRFRTNQAADLISVKKAAAALHVKRQKWLNKSATFRF